MQNKDRLEESKDVIKQKQVAGDGSNQIQAKIVNVYNGVSEERAREIFNEMIPQALNTYTQEAYNTAEERIRKLENMVIPRIMENDDVFRILSDPRFQMLLRKAQLSAASTDIYEDYELLSELIMRHIEKGVDRKNRTGISKAIEIVGEVDSDALCALTIAFALLTYFPTTGIISAGLETMNEFYEKLLYMALPDGGEWIDHLEVLGALRISSLGRLKQINQIYSNSLNGYICVGIKTDSNEYEEAQKILNNQNLDSSLLKEHELLEGYSRLIIRNKDSIKSMNRIDASGKHLISDNEIHALEAIWNMYSKDNTLLQMVKNEFSSRWDAFNILKQVRTWWEKIPMAFDLTGVGRALAYTNAKRCAPELTDIL